MIFNISLFRGCFPLGNLSPAASSGFVPSPGGRWSFSPARHRFSLIFGVFWGKIRLPVPPCPAGMVYWSPKGLRMGRGGDSLPGWRRMSSGWILMGSGELSKVTEGSLTPLFITGEKLLPRIRIKSTAPLGFLHTGGVKMGLGVLGRGLSLPPPHQHKGILVWGCEIQDGAAFLPQNCRIQPQSAKPKKGVPRTG